MGLPLFVAPSDSNQPSKTANKSGSASPRSGVRRHPSSEPRDRRSRRIARISSALNRQAPGAAPGEWTDSPEQLTPEQLTEALAAARRAGFRIHNPDDAPVPSVVPWSWTDDPLPVPIPPTAVSGPFRQALREMTQSDEHGPDRSEPPIDGFTDTRPRGSWRAVPRVRSWDPVVRDGGQPDHRGAFHRRGERRARIAAPVATRFDRSPDRPLGTGDAPGVLPNATSRSAVRDPAEYLDDQMLSALTRAQYGQRHISRTRVGGSRHLPPSRRARGLDGLGDRERSLSPEWDTLLSTLTPDPQPPSAGSSFASAAASQSAGASSHTTPPAPDAAESTAAEPPCESGFENSDGEEGQTREAMDLSRHRRHRALLLRANSRVPDYNLDGSMEGQSSASARSRSSSVPRRPPPADALSSLRNRPLWYDELVSGRPGHIDAWVGRLSVGASEDEQRQERALRNRDASPMLSQNASATEEDWPGMRRIVRSMAMREDIPDDWWAEVGLSQPLSRDDAN